MTQKLLDQTMTSTSKSASKTNNRTVTSTDFDDEINQIEANTAYTRSAKSDDTSEYFAKSKL